MCGVFGVYGHPEAAKLTYLGLHALQHRGQEAAGIVALSEGTLAKVRGQGLVADVFNETAMTKLGGEAAIGHVRYSTSSGPDANSTQPFAVNTMRGALAIAHNGNLVNAPELRSDLVRDGALFSSESDTETLVHLLARSRAPRLEDRVREAVAQAEGAYTLVFLHPKGMMGVRDPRGIRPLVLGRLGDATVLASETSSLELIGAELIREVEPGEIVHVTDKGIRSERLHHDPDAQERACIFELVYFARPDSQIFDQSVYESRVRMGEALAQEHAVEADLVIPVPDSGVAAALGYANESGLPFRHGLIRSHYVGRTFIEPSQSIRNFGVKLKLSAVKSVIAGKRVVVIDDSIVRGTTSRKIVELIRAAGASEVHVRICCPPTRFPCFYGIDTPNRGELIAAQHDIPAIAEAINADSLGYLSVAGLHKAAEDSSEGRYCNACFTGKYSTGNELVQLRLQEETS